jgi:hypothetical protein
MAVKYGWVRLTCKEPDLNAVLKFGPEPPKLSRGLGWTVVDHPRQTGMTVWQGGEPWRLKFDVVFDQWRSLLTRGRRSGYQDVESELWYFRRAINAEPPGVITIEGIPNLPRDRWVCEEAEEGPYIRGGHMNKLRQFYSLTFMEYNPPQFIQIRRGARVSPRRRVIVIRARRGDTPTKIARRQKCKWVDIRELNKSIVKRANQTLKTGIRLRVPA